MITKDKVTEIFCIIDEFDKNLDGELKKKTAFTQPGFVRCQIKVHNWNLN